MKIHDACKAGHCHCEPLIENVMKQSVHFEKDTLNG